MKILLIVLCIVAIGVGGFLFYQSQQDDTDTETTNTVVHSDARNTNTEDQTSQVVSFNTYAVSVPLEWKTTGRIHETGSGNIVITDPSLLAVNIECPIAPLINEDEITPVSEWRITKGGQTFLLDRRKDNFTNAEVLSIFLTSQKVQTVEQAIENDDSRSCRLLIYHDRVTDDIVEKIYDSIDVNDSAETLTSSELPGCDSLTQTEARALCQKISDRLQIVSHSFSGSALKILEKSICWMNDSPAGAILNFPEGEYRTLIGTLIDSQVQTDLACLDYEPLDLTEGSALIAQDQDRDSVNFLLEILYDIDDNNKDTDDDGYDDLSEIVNGYNPNGNGEFEWSLLE